MGNFFKKIMPYVKRYFKGRLEKWIIRTLIGTGTLILLSALTQNQWLSFIVNIYNDQLNRNVSDPQNTNNYIVLSVEVIVGILLIVLGINFYFRTKKREKLSPMVRIEQSSIQTVSYAKINRDLADYNIESYPLNQLEEMKNIDSGSIYHALREQEKLVERVSSRLDGSTDIEVSYFGLAHIPLTVLMGYQMSDKLNVSFYEWNQNNSIWEAIESKPNVQYPPLLLEKNDTAQEIQNTKEVVIKIGVTYPISEEVIKEVKLDRLNSYYLQLDPPQRNAILSSEQLKSYKEIFRDLLDQINQRYPHLQMIHLFYSGQPSLAYTLGSAISSRMDHEIWIYNHVQTETPKYKWGIRLPLKNKPIELKIN